MAYALTNIKKVEVITNENNIIALNNKLQYNGGKTQSDLNKAMKRLYNLSNESIEDIKVTKEYNILEPLELTYDLTEKLWILKLNTLKEVQEFETTLISDEIGYAEVIDINIQAGPITSENVALKVNYNKTTHKINITAVTIKTASGNLGYGDSIRIITQYKEYTAPLTIRNYEN